MKKYIYQGSQPYLNGSIAVAKGDEVELDEESAEVKNLVEKKLIAEKPETGNKNTKPENLK